MKKILLISFFDSKNWGDILIGEQLCSLLGKYFEYEKIDFSSTTVNRKSNTCIQNETTSKKIIKKITSRHRRINELLSYLYMRISLKKKYKQMQDILASCDMIVLAGGNMIMDLNKYPIYTYKTYYPLKLSKQLKKKSAVLFVGAGPFQTKQQKKYAKKIIQTADFISVRDEISKDLLKSICNDKPIHMWSDPVFTLDTHYKIYNNNHCLGVSIFFGTDQTRHTIIKNAYISIILELRQRFPDYTIKLFSSVITDYEQVSQVYEALNDKNITIQYAKTKNDLFQIYTSSDLVLASRMHSMIIGFILRKPVISFSWQSKVDGLMELMDMKNRNFSISEIEHNIDNVVAAVNDIVNNMDYNVKDIDNKVKKTSYDIQQNVKKFAEEC